MIKEPELLNERLERLAMVLDEIMPNCALLVRDALALLKNRKRLNRKYHAQNSVAVIVTRSSKWTDGKRVRGAER